MDLILIGVFFFILAIALMVLILFMKEAEQNKARNDIIEIDESLPTETVIYYSKKKTFLYLLFCSGFMLFSLIALFSDIFPGISGTVLFGFSFVLGLILTIVFFVLLFNKNPQFIINDSGFKIAKNSFKNWSDVENERVLSGRENHIRYNNKGGYQNQLGVLFYDDISRELRVMLKTYRARYEDSKKVISE